MADKGVLLGMLAETALHPGAGQSADVVDLPVAREGATQLPHIPETGLKGALKQWAKQTGGLEIEKLFGKSDEAGELLISTARLLCLPVRRLDGPYAWATSPYLLERLRRDTMRVGQPLNPPDLDPQGAQLLVADGAKSTIFLEEYCFTPQGLNGHATALAESVGKLIADPGVGARLMEQIAVMSDKEFHWFAQYGLPVDARNALNEAKMSENLWYEETIPPDALFYSLILPRNADADARIRRETFIEKLKKDGYLQVGGNETVGQGWVRLTVVGA